MKWNYLVLKVLKPDLFSKAPFSWGFGLFWGFFAVQMLQMVLAKAKQNNRTGSREILLGQTGEGGPALPRIPGHFCSSCKVQCNHRAEKMILLQEDPWYSPCVRSQSFCAAGVGVTEGTGDVNLPWMSYSMNFPGRNAGIAVLQQVRDVLSTLTDFAANHPQRHSTPGFSICSCLNLGKCSCKPAPSAEEPL